MENRYRGQPEICVYYDTYFDGVNKDLQKSERELRLRRIMLDDSETVRLTCKEPPFDNISKSKHEHEITVSSYRDTAAILNQLGYREDISLAKHCTNFQVELNSLPILVTLAALEELGQDYIEAEALLSEPGKQDQVLACLYDFLVSLQVMPEQLTNEYYTEMVRRSRDSCNQA